MVRLTDKRFGVVHTSPSNLITNAASLEDGKLYFAAGDASGLVKQGIYGVVGITTDGSIDIDGNGSGKQLAMFGTGAVADGTGYGLSQANFTTDEKNKLAGIAANANNYSLPLAATNTRGGIQVGFTAKDASIPVLLSGEDAYVQLTKNSIEKGLGCTIDASVPSDAKFTDTDTWRAIKVNGTEQIHNNVSTALDISAGNNIEVSFTNNKVVIAAKNVDASNADYATNATNASTADKVAQTFDVSFDGADILSFNGSTNKTLAFKEGSNIDITNFNGTLTIATTGVPTTAQMNDAIQLALTSALKYKGTVDGSASKLPTTHAAGDVYVASASFETTAAETGNAYKVESGDYFISNGTIFNVVNGENQVSDASATLTPGSTNLKLATVDGTDITVNVPALPSIVNKLNNQLGELTTSYETSTFAPDSSYRLGTLTIAGKEHIIYGKDTNTIYVHPASISGVTLADTSLKSTTATSLSYAGSFTVATGVYRDASGHISEVATETFKLPSQYSHPAAGIGIIDMPTNLSIAATLLTRVKIDSSGHVTDTTAFNGTVGGTTTPVYFNAGVPTALNYTIAKSVPSNAVFTDTKVTANTSTGIIYLIGQDDATNGTNEIAYKNANVYMSDGALYANSASVDANATALVSGEVVYNAVQDAKSEAIEAATIYWETL